MEESFSYLLLLRKSPLSMRRAGGDRIDILCIRYYACCQGQHPYQCHLLPSMAPFRIRKTGQLVKQHTLYMAGFFLLWLAKQRRCRSVGYTLYRASEDETLYMVPDSLLSFIVPEFHLYMHLILSNLTKTYLVLIGFLLYYCKLNMRWVIA